MAIGNTKLDILVRRVRLISETVAWLETFNTVTKNQIIEWIQKDQLTNKGVDKFGEVIGYYSFATELITKGKKKFNAHYTLFDTGDFYRSMYVAVFQTEIVINANANKGKDNLFRKFGDGIIGLTDENFNKLKEIVKDSYIKHVRKALQIV